LWASACSSAVVRWRSGGVDDADVLPDHLIFAVAKDLLCAGIPRGEQAAQVGREDRIAGGTLNDQTVPFAAVTELDLGPPAVGDVLDREQNHLGFVPLTPELAGVEDHPPPAEALEDVVDFEVAERVVPGEDLFEECPEPGDVPLAVAQLVDEPAVGLLGNDAEGAVEGAVGRAHAEVGPEDDERLPHRVDDALGKLSGTQRSGGSRVMDGRHGR